MRSRVELLTVKMKNKNGEEIQIKADAGVSFNGIIDLSSVSGFKDFVLPGQNEYSVYIWMNDTRNTQEGFVTLSGLEFITSSPSEEYTTYSSAEGWIGDSQAEINCRYPGLEMWS